jgi:methyl coenzyme M reductase beta subunit
MNDIEKKYEPKKWAAYLGGGAGLAVAGAAMLPILSPLLGVAIPAVAAAAALGGGALGFGKEKLGELAEKRQAQHSMIGMLATARTKVQR